ncbi:MAG: GspH/FimT family pseudopilin [Rhodoferax sp.]|nr:GspH/FimT family pseudopilin [Rhodoferax sp.]
MRTVAVLRSAGFTLVELMVTVAMLAILIALAAPSFQSLLSGLQVSNTAFALVSDLTLARNEAVKRGTNVQLAPGVASDWSQGWTVSVPSPATTLRQQASTGHGVNFLNAPASITFGADGRSTGVAVYKFNLTNGSSKNVCVSLDPSGLPRTASRAC